MSMPGILLFQREIAAAVIQMMVGVEDVGEFQPVFRQCLAHGFRFRWIDHGAKARFTPHQIGVIVGQAGDESDVHGFVPLCAAT
jgi:hypothetical protein